MLRPLSPENKSEFRMSVVYEREISIKFTDIFEYLKNCSDAKKLIFIDPVVLSYQERFLDGEAKQTQNGLMDRSAEGHDT